MLRFFKARRPTFSPADKDHPITDTRYVIIDTELTGLDERRDSIISIGAVRMTGARIELGETFYRLIKPEAKFKPESVVIHGITPSEVDEEPGIEAVLQEFVRFCDKDILVGHCVSIDLGFVNRAMKKLYGEAMPNIAVDTYRIYEWLARREPSRFRLSSLSKGPALYDLAKCFGISVRGAHDALADSFITAQLFQRFIPVLADHGVKRIGDLLRIGHPSKGGDRSGTSGEITNF